MKKKLFCLLLSLLMLATMLPVSAVAETPTQEPPAAADPVAEPEADPKNDPADGPKNDPADAPQGDPAPAADPIQVTVGEEPKQEEEQQVEEQQVEDQQNEDQKDDREVVPAVGSSNEINKEEEQEKEQEEELQDGRLQEEVKEEEPEEQKEEGKEEEPEEQKEDADALKEEEKEEEQQTAAPAAYSVTFAVNGETVTVTVPAGERIGESMPADPVLGDAYIFEGWFDENGNWVDAWTEVNGPMTVTARFMYLPAGSDSASAGGITVTATWNAGVFPEGTTLTIDPQGKDKALAMAENALPEGYEAVDGEAVDITFIADGVSVQPYYGSVSVSISLSRALEGDSFRVLHEGAARRRMMTNGAKAGSGSNIETVSASASATGATFSGSGFSVYAVVGAEAVNRVQVSFKVGDNEIEGATQIVKAGDTLAKPSDPADPNGSAPFTGWKLGTTAIDDGYFDPAVLTDEQITTLANGQAFTDDNHHLVTAVLTAAFDAQYTVTFLEAENSANVADTRTVASGGTVSLSDINYAPPAGKKLTGWTVDGNTVYTDKIEGVSANMTLYPVLEAGHWVHFHVNGGNSVNPLFIEPNGKAAEPNPTPQKQGYVLSGWYDNEALTGDPFDFENTQITEEKHLYAKWAEGESDYYILFYVENANDDDYTYYTAKKQTGTTNGRMTLSQEAETWFLNETKADGVNYYFKDATDTAASIAAAENIKADGTSTLNVYFDRVWWKFKSAVNGVEHNAKWGQTASSFMGDMGLEFGVSAAPGMLRNVTFTYPQNSSSHFWGSGRFNNPDVYLTEPVPSPATFLSRRGYEIPSGSTIILNWADYNAPWGYQFYFYYETIDSTEDSPQYAESYQLSYFTAEHYGFKEAGTPKFTPLRVENDDYDKRNDGWYYPKTTSNPRPPVYRYFSRNKFNIDFTNIDGTIVIDPSAANPVTFDASTGGAIEQVFCETPLIRLAEQGGFPFQEGVTTREHLGRKYIFAGWYKDALLVTKLGTDETMPDAHLELFAKWVPITHTVKFDANYEGAADIDDQVLAYGSKVIEPDVSREGYTLLGWFDDNGQLWNFVQGEVNGDINLTARWVPPLVYYTVQYAGANPPSDAASYAAGSVIPLKPGSDDGEKQFIGWTLTAPQRAAQDTRPLLNGTVDAVAANADSNKVIHLYPVYSTMEQPMVNVTYHSNFPNGAAEKTFPSPAVSVNGEVTIDACPTGWSPSGYRFIGWAASATAATVAYDAGDTWAIDTNEDLYALWAAEVTVTVTGSTKTVKYDGTEQSNTGYTVTYKVAGETVTSLPDGVTAQINPSPVEAKGTDAGTYSVTVSVTLSSTSALYTVPADAATADVVLIVEPRTVTLTSETAEKVYDGTALTKPDVTVGGDGFVDGEVTDLAASGAVTDVTEGEVTNAITYTEGPAFKAKNYTVTKTEGKLKITPAPLTITVKDQTYTYNGKAQGESNATYTSDFDKKVTVSGLVGGDKLTGVTLDGSEKKAGVYADRIKASGAAVGDLTANYTITYVPGKLTITDTDDTPSTGDNTNMVLWASLMLISAIGCAGALLLAPRKRRTWR